MPNRARTTLRAAVAALLGAAAGCAGPSTLTWSPDGSHAVYSAQNGSGQVVVVDRGGRVLAPLPATFGEVGWSPDSSTAYFGTDDRGGPRPAAVSHRWAGGDDEPAGGSTADATAVGRWRAGHVDRLVAIDDALVTAVRPSPDGRWLVIEAQAGGSSLARALVRGLGYGKAAPGGPGLYAYSLPSGRLYRLASSVVASGFTGPDRLAIVEPTAPDVGQIVEQTLDESAAQPDRRPRVAVLPDATTAPQPAAGGLVFLTTAAAFPAPPSAPPATALFRVRPDGRLDRLADAVVAAGLAFSVSPDGRRILFCQAADHGGGPDGRGPADELAVMDADGSHRHRLMTLAGIPSSSVKPAWHGSGRITFVSTAAGQPVPAGAGQADRTVYDVVDYDVPPDGPLVPVTTLSRDWPVDLKPSDVNRWTDRREAVPAPAAPPAAVVPAGPLAPAVQSAR